jgi:carboxymethylenebutenolidase
MAKAVPAALLVERPPIGAGPGVLVLHSWWGLTPSIRNYCRQLAAHGFVAAAPDLFSARTAATIDEAKRLRSLPRSEPVYKMLMRSIDMLLSDSAVAGREIGVVGFSMGGHWAAWLSQHSELPITATTLYYAARGGNFSKSHSHFLAHFAENDEWVSDAAKLRMMNAIFSADLSLETYDQTEHWFAESDRRAEFNKAAAQLAFQRTVAHLRKTLMSSDPVKIAV